MICNRSWLAWVAAFPALICGWEALAQTLPPDAPPNALPFGLRPHRVPVVGGRIDWTDGTIVADGIGRARGRTARDRLMAQRAAELVAARNVVAAVADVRISADGRVEGMQAGDLSIRGILYGQEVLRSEWFPDSNPPYARVTVSVPLNGVLGISPVAASDEPATLPDAAAPSLVILDARGVALAESLFPAVLDEQGRVVWNSASTSGRTARVRYAEALAEADPGWERPGSMVNLAKTSRPVGSDVRLSSEPSPASRTTRVRVVRAAGPDRTQLVISSKDAAVLARATGAIQVRPPQVIVLVDRAGSPR